MDIFVNLIPATGRKWLYGIVALAAAAYGIYEAASGDWTQFAVGIVTALSTALAHANVTQTPEATPPVG